MQLQNAIYLPVKQEQIDCSRIWIKREIPVTRLDMDMDMVDLMGTVVMMDIVIGL